MKAIIIACPEVKPQGVLANQESVNGRARRPTKKKTVLVAVGVAGGLAALWFSSRSPVPSSHEKQGPHSNGQIPTNFLRAK